MQIDNQKTTIRIWLWKMFLACFFAGLVVLFLTTTWFNKPVLGLERIDLILITAGLYLLIIIIIYLLDLNYIYFNDDGDQIILRYYPMRPFARKKMAFQIPKISLAGFDIKKSFFGLKKSLILQQKTKKGIATYPGIGINALNRREIELIVSELKRFVRP
jgi:hypothetical protein